MKPKLSETKELTPAEREALDQAVAVFIREIESGSDLASVLSPVPDELKDPDWGLHWMYFFNAERREFPRHVKIAELCGWYRPGHGTPLSFFAAPLPDEMVKPEERGPKERCFLRIEAEGEVTPAGILKQIEKYRSHREFVGAMMVLQEVLREQRTQ